MWQQVCPLLLLLTLNLRIGSSGRTTANGGFTVHSAADREREEILNDFLRLQEAPNGKPHEITDSNDNVSCFFQHVRLRPSLTEST